jgi:hypothetical protein
VTTLNEDGSEGEFDLAVPGDPFKTAEAAQAMADRMNRGEAVGSPPHDFMQLQRDWEDHLESMSRQPIPMTADRPQDAEPLTSDEQARLQRFARGVMRGNDGTPLSAVDAQRIHAETILRYGSTVQALRARLSVLEAENVRLRNQRRDLIVAGEQMSNVAFNLVQRGVLPPSANVDLDRVRSQWDTVRESAVVSPPAGSPPNE